METIASKSIFSILLFKFGSKHYANDLARDKNAHYYNFPTLYFLCLSFISGP
jgi:hypothetical protein